MKYTLKLLNFILLVVVFTTQLPGQIIHSGSNMELQNMDYSVPCTHCSEWRYSRTDKTMYRFNRTSGFWEVWANKTPLSNILYVSQARGNNSRAKKGSIDNAWKDPWAAKYTASSGDIIHVLDGIFTIDTVSTLGATKICKTYHRDSCSLMKNNVTYIFEKGTKIDYLRAVQTPIFYDSVGIKTTFLGEAVISFDVHAVDGLFNLNALSKPGRRTDFRLECDSLIIGTANTGGVNGNPWTRAGHWGDVKNFIVKANVLYAYQIQFHRMYSIDTLKNARVELKFDKVYSYYSDVLFGFGNPMFDSQINVDINYYFVDMVYYDVDLGGTMINSQINFRVRDLYAKRHPTASSINQNLFRMVGGSTNVRINSIQNIEIGSGTLISNKRNPVYLYDYEGTLNAASKGFLLNLEANIVSDTSIIFAGRTLYPDGNKFVIKNSNFMCANGPLAVNYSTGTRLFPEFHNTVFKVRDGQRIFDVTQQLTAGPLILFGCYLDSGSGQAFNSTVPLTVKASGSYANVANTDPDVTFTTFSILGN